MKKDYLLECSVDSVESAINAEKGGADRIELCSNLVIGGTTPDLFLFREVRKHTNIKIHVLIRPRFGDFLYSDYEMEIIRQNVSLFKNEGADGVVIGCLTKDGELDRKNIEHLIRLSKGMKVALHRAFDVCKEPFQTLQETIDLGIDIILTSGQSDNCYEGRDLIKNLLKEAGDRIDIMPGAGVNAEVIRKFLNQMEITSFHMSGKKVLESKMIYRKEGVNMGLPSLSEYEIWQTDTEEVAKAKKVLVEYGSK